MRLILTALIALCFACNPSEHHNPMHQDAIHMDPLAGVWEVSNQYYVKDGDTLYRDPDGIAVDHKIYLDGFVIWASEAEADSTECQGFGTYELNNDMLIETYSSMSSALKSHLGAAEHIHFHLQMGKKTQTQGRKTLFRGTDYLLVTEWRKMN